MSANDIIKQALERAANLVKAEIDKGFDLQAALDRATDAEICTVCEQPFSEHDGREQHRFQARRA